MRARLVLQHLLSTEGARPSLLWWLDLPITGSITTLIGGF